jgi:hypothetical protein
MGCIASVFLGWVRAFLSGGSRKSRPQNGILRETPAPSYVFFRARISATVAGPADIEEEIRDLFAALGS